MRDHFSLFPGYASGGMFKPQEEIRKPEVQESLIKVRHLFLGIEVTSDALDGSLMLMPNLRSIFLGNLHITPEELLIITANRSQKLEKLGIRNANQRIVDVFLDLHSSSLRELELAECKEPSQKLRNCTKLRQLKLSTPGESACINLETILLNAPDMKHSDIQTCGIETANLRSIDHLKRLQSFVSPFGVTVVGDIIQKLRTISTLQHLNLSDAGISVRALREVVRLRGLKSPDLLQFPSDTRMLRRYE